MYKTPNKLGSNLRCQTDTLGFTATERLGFTVQTQIAQTNIDQKIEAVPDFLENLSTDLSLTLTKFKLIQCIAQGNNIQLNQIGYGIFADLIRQRLPVKTPSTAGRTNRFFPINALALSRWPADLESSY